MIVKFEDPKCGCCPLSPHGYGVPVNIPGPKEKQFDEHGKGVMVDTIARYDSRTIVIKPGTNVLSAKDYEILKADNIFMHRVETGSYRVDEKVSGDSLVGMDQPDAIELVRETLDRNILKKWLVDDQRRPVREAIDAQLEKVKPEVKADAAGGGKK